VRRTYSSCVIRYRYEQVYIATVIRSSFQNTFRSGWHLEIKKRRSVSFNRFREGHGSIPDQSMWDLWWTKWHWDRSLYEYFFFFPVIRTAAPDSWIHLSPTLYNRKKYIRQTTHWEGLSISNSFFCASFGRLDSFDFRDLNSIARLAPSFSLCYVCGK
jgi:hypothetical protein